MKTYHKSEVILTVLMVLVVCLNAAKWSEKRTVGVKCFGQQWRIINVDV
jgi:hypothetical protein